MFILFLSERFEKSFSNIRDTEIRKQIWKKVCQLEIHAPLGKKLKGNPYWSLHIGRYRVIYEMKGNELHIADILEREHEYRELR